MCRIVRLLYATKLCVNGIVNRKLASSYLPYSPDPCPPPNVLETERGGQHCRESIGRSQK